MLGPHVWVNWAMKKPLTASARSLAPQLLLSVRYQNRESSPAICSGRKSCLSAFPQVVPVAWLGASRLTVLLRVVDRLPLSPVATAGNKGFEVGDVNWTAD